jgi:hypothetical protein
MLWQKCACTAATHPDGILINGPAGRTQVYDPINTTNTGPVQLAMQTGGSVDSVEGSAAVSDGERAYFVGAGLHGVCLLCTQLRRSIVDRLQRAHVQRT